MSDFKAKKEEISQKTLRLMLQIAFIFAIPAFLAFFVGRWIDDTYNIDQKGTLFCLLISFIFSWFLVIREYKKINSELTEIKKQEDVVKQAKQNKINENLKKLEQENKK